MGPNPLSPASPKKARPPSPLPRVKDGAADAPRPLSRSDALYFAALIILGGAGSMVLEVAGSRLLAPFFGNTILLWASQISVVLAALSAGYYMGGRWADAGDPWPRLSSLLLLSGLWVMLSPLTIVPLALVSFSLGPLIGPLCAAALLFGFPIFTLATITPSILASMAPDRAHIGRVSGMLYALSTATSIGGTLATGFILVPALGVRVIFGGVGLLMMLLALARLRGGQRFLLGVMPLGLVALTGFHAPGTVWEGDSLYYHLRVADEGSMRWLFLDSDLHSGQRLNSSELAFGYTRAMEAAALSHPGTGRALFLGLGGGALPKRLLDGGRLNGADGVEIDPAVVEAATRFFGFPADDPRLRVHIGDGRRFLESARESYSLVMLDAYASHYSVPYHLLTGEFFDALRPRLQPGGLVVLNLISPPHSGLAPHVRATLGGRFPEVWTYCTDEGSERIQNLVILAWDPEGPLAGWQPPARLADAALCAAGIDRAAPFSDDWAPTDFILATQS